MTPAPSFRYASFWRLAQVRMAGVVLLIQVLTAAVFLAQSGLAQRELNRESGEARALADAARLVSAAQAAFRGQVQEWKNILLRGHDPADFAQYRLAMRYRANQFSTSLSLANTTAGGAADFLADAISAIDRDASALLETYETALGARETLPVREARAIDTRLRSADRALEERIDLLAQRLLAASGERQRDAAQAAAQRANHQSRSVLAGLGVSILAVFILLFMSLKGSPGTGVEASR